MANIFTNAINFLGATLKQTITSDFLRDFTHANQLFVGQDFELVPKSGNLFHVYFDINPTLASNYMIDGETAITLGMMVKSADLPKYSIENKLYNAYNRPNLVQSKIKFEQINITFHDDSMNTVRNFWYDYYRYYFRDSDSSEEGYHLNYKYQGDPLSGKFGYTRKFESHANYLKSIRIYSLSRREYSEYILIKPIITAFKHSEHDYFNTASSNLNHTMTIAYENVLYREGDLLDNSVTGFAMLRYDRRPSPLNRLGTRKSIFGKRGLLDTAGSIIGDITQGNFLSAIFKYATARQTFKGVNIAKAAVSEAKQILTVGATNVITGAITNQMRQAPLGGRTVISPLSLDGVVKNAYNGIARDTGTIALIGAATLLNSVSTSKKYTQTPIVQANKSAVQNNYNPSFPTVPGVVAPQQAPSQALIANYSNSTLSPTNQLSLASSKNTVDLGYDIKVIDKQIRDISASISYTEKQISQQNILLSNLNNRLAIARASSVATSVITDLEEQIATTTAQKSESTKKLNDEKNTLTILQNQYNVSIKQLNNLR